MYHYICTSKADKNITFNAVMYISEARMHQIIHKHIIMLLVYVFTYKTDATLL